MKIPRNGDMGNYIISIIFTIDTNADWHLGVKGRALHLQKPKIQKFVVEIREWETEREREAERVCECSEIEIEREKETKKVNQKQRMNTKWKQRTNNKSN